jgi:hypothetical protein
VRSATVTDWSSKRYLSISAMQREGCLHCRDLREGSHRLLVVEDTHTASIDYDSIRDGLEGNITTTTTRLKAKAGEDWCKGRVVPSSIP